MENQNTTPSITTETPALPTATPRRRTRFMEAYDRRLTEIRNIKESELITANLDFQGAIFTALGALPHVEALQKELDQLAFLDKTLVGSLRDYTEAAAEAHAKYIAATTPKEDIVALNEKATHLRDVLRAEATALATRNLLDESAFKAFTGLSGYRNVSFELSGWASILHDAWSRIEEKTGLTLDEILEAKDIAEDLLEAAGVRELSPAAIAEVGRIRRQAITLLARSYEEVRRAVIYLRWHQEDDEKIAPSLHGSRNRKKRDGAASEEPAQGGSTAPAPGSTPAPVTPPPSPAPLIPQGVPGASPFAS